MDDPKKHPLPLWSWVILLAGLAAAGIVYFYGPALESPRQTNGTALVGGPFELVDQTGAKFTEARLAGKYSIIYFGYTFCPDICPTELQTIAEALDKLSPGELEKIQPIFITVDPARDTVPVMAKYVTLFHPRLIGLTGTENQIKAAEKAYRVYADKAPSQDKDSKDYLMNHTSVTYLMGPDGKFLDHFANGATPDKIAETIKKNLE